MQRVMLFVRNEDGATAIEYGLIAATISIAIAAVLGDVSTSLVNTFALVASLFP
jgi:pilus assembly protein Flp/PilA